MAIEAPNSSSSSSSLSSPSSPSSSVASSPEADVFLVTFRLAPDGEEQGSVIVSALAARGLRARWVFWDDATVPWPLARLIIPRSTWDNHRRTAPYLEWLRTAVPEREHGKRLLLHPETYRWGVDKEYLVDLEKRGVPIVPTYLLDDDEHIAVNLARALERPDWGRKGIVVKPRMSADGIGVVQLKNLEGACHTLSPGPWVVQPIVQSIRTEGEVSVFVFGGKVVGPQIRKRPGSSASTQKKADDNNNSDETFELRVHSTYGGGQISEPLGEETARLASMAVKAAGEILGGRTGGGLAYARVDMMFWKGAWVVSELEAVDPALYADIEPKIADRFAEFVEGWLGMIEGN
jgi:hypothetical protein